MKTIAKLVLVHILTSVTIWAGDFSSQRVLQDKRSKTAILYEDFNGDSLEPSKWLIARSQWGGEDANGGVVPDNIYIRHNKLIINGYGDKYSGPVRGVRRVHGQFVSINHGRRTGACLVTRDCYASGRYEVRMKVPQHLGVCTALWVFNYLEVDKDHEEYIANKGNGSTYISNHEIDIELPGRPGSEYVEIGYDWALFNTWLGTRDQDMTFGPTKLPFKVNDGMFHTWRFDWHTGDPEGQSGEVIKPRVEFYLDDKLFRTITTKVPTIAGHFWIGLWFPKDWAGEPDFEVEMLEVDWVRITPFHEPGDQNKYSQRGPNHWLLGPEDWPRRLQPANEEDSNNPE